MLQTYLVNILIFCGILLLLALTVAVVQMVMILVDFRKVVGEARKKTMVLVSAIDIATIKAGLVALVVGIQKIMRILFKKRRDKNG